MLECDNFIFIILFKYLSFLFHWGMELHFRYIFGRLILISKILIICNVEIIQFLNFIWLIKLIQFFLRVYMFFRWKTRSINYFGCRDLIWVIQVSKYFVVSVERWELLSLILLLCKSNHFCIFKIIGCRKYFSFINLYTHFIFFKTRQISLFYFLSLLMTLKLQLVFWILLRSWLYFSWTLCPSLTYFILFFRFKLIGLKLYPFKILRI